MNAYFSPDTIRLDDPCQSRCCEARPGEPVGQPVPEDIARISIEAARTVTPEATDENMDRLYKEYLSEQPAEIRQRYQEDMSRLKFELIEQFDSPRTASTQPVTLTFEQRHKKFRDRIGATIALMQLLEEGARKLGSDEIDRDALIRSMEAPLPEEY